MFKDKSWAHILRVSVTPATTPVRHALPEGRYRLIPSSSSACKSQA